MTSRQIVRALALTLTFAALSLITAHVVRTRSEERAITTIIRAGGHVYYGFQDPQLSVRKRPSRAAASVTNGVARIGSYQVPVREQSPFTPAIARETFAVDDSNVKTASALVEASANANTQGTTNTNTADVFDERQPYFVVLAVKGCRVHMAERIVTDLLRRIECATVRGTNLDEQVLTALTNLRRLRQLIVYDSNPRQRAQLAKQLPDVEIIWR